MAGQAPGLLRIRWVLPKKHGTTGIRQEMIPDSQSPINLVNALCAVGIYAVVNRDGAPRYLQPSVQEWSTPRAPSAAVPIRSGRGGSLLSCGDVESNPGPKSKGKSPSPVPVNSGFTGPLAGIPAHAPCTKCPLSDKCFFLQASTASHLNEAHQESLGGIGPSLF